jgi:hypothetical protein
LVERVLPGLNAGAPPATGIRRVGQVAVPHFNADAIIRWRKPRPDVRLREIKILAPQNVADLHLNVALDMFVRLHRQPGAKPLVEERLRTLIIRDNWIVEIEVGRIKHQAVLPP